MTTTSTHRSSLSAEQLAMLDDMLAEQVQFRTEQIAALVRETRDSPHARTDAGAQVRDALLLGAHVALTASRAARIRIARGTYGRCLSCNQPLVLAQLEVLPDSGMCADCRHRAKR